MAKEKPAPLSVSHGRSENRCQRTIEDAFACSGYNCGHIHSQAVAHACIQESRRHEGQEDQGDSGRMPEPWMVMKASGGSEIDTCLSSEKKPPDAPSRVPWL